MSLVLFGIIIAGILSSKLKLPKMDNLKI